MNPDNHPLRIAIFGLSITSSWGNGHATTYRALVRALAKRGHHLCFYERQQAWYAHHRDLPQPGYCTVELYDSVGALDDLFPQGIDQGIDADVILIGSYVPEGARVAEWVLSRARPDAVTVFYDIDTPVTLARLAAGDCPYLEPALVPEFDLYLSFTAGPTLERLRRELGAQRAHELFCSVDTDEYYPESREVHFDLGYLGTYSDDRQAKLETLMFEPARHWSAGRFCVAGAQYPKTVAWPPNLRHIEHLPPPKHRSFYNEQRFTLNLTREDMVKSGHSPSVRLFEAAACGVPIISDAWNGLEELFVPGVEILLATDAGDVLAWLRDLAPDDARQIGLRARKRVLGAHTSAHRAEQFEQYVRIVQLDRALAGLTRGASSSPALQG